MAKLNINGKTLDLEIDGATPLLWAIREHADLTGTKYGCGVGQCGACSIHINGEVQRSCLIQVKDVKSTDQIVTIEGLADPSGRAVQKAWLDLEVAQCGYCQTGQIMNAAALLAKTPAPTDAEIDSAMAGNLCRCGCYQRIHAAVRAASKGT